MMLKAFDLQVTVSDYAYHQARIRKARGVPKPLLVVFQFQVASE